MPKVIRVKVNNSEILVETDDSITPPAVNNTRTERAFPHGAMPPGNVSGLVGDLKEVKAAIVDASKIVLEAAEEIKPSKLSVEFAIKLVGETGVPMLVKASGEASFKVTVEWDKLSQRD